MGQEQTVFISHIPIPGLADLPARDEIGQKLHLQDKSQGADELLLCGVNRNTDDADQFVCCLGAGHLADNRLAGGLGGLKITALRDINPLIFFASFQDAGK